ncbi:Protein F09A5.2 [Aphelenchoides avenae]|nr:Protein F09A5.2 [Aphelenchus avenae]
MTADDLYYAVNVSVGTNVANAQQFSLAVDLKGSDTTLGDASLKPRHRRGFVPNNATDVQENDPGYYIMKGYVQFSKTVRLFLDYIVVINRWNASVGYLLPYTSQPFDGVLGLVNPAFIQMYSVSFDKTCSNGAVTDAGTLTINGLDSRNCDEFSFANRSRNMCFPFLTLQNYAIFMDNVTDLSLNTVVIADVPYIYLPTTTFNHFNEVYNAQKEGDVYVVDCDANHGPLMIAIADGDDDDGDALLLNYTDLIERIDDRRCAFRVRPSTGDELQYYGCTVDFILGLPFLQRYCVAANSIGGDFETKRIGFATKTSERQASRICDYRGSVPAQEGLRPGLIVLVVVATFVSLCVVITVGCYCYRRRRKAANQQKRDRWQIQENELNLDTAREIGSGAFAKVFVVEVKKSLEKRLNEGKGVAVRKAKVVVKVARRTSEEIKHDMQQEVDLMKELGSHPHIVNFIGHVATECPLIVMEYCANGDLLNYLRTHLQSHKESVKNVNEYLQPACYINSGLSLKHLISLCWQISDGLVYLTSKGFIHRDLAARNVLLTEGLVAKISDFGLCRCTDDDVYLTKRHAKLPVRWMAPESLQRATYSAKTDVCV